jgi:DNA-binding CsgD family transcriptional regulator
VVELLECPDDSGAVADGLIRALETISPGHSYVIGFLESNVRPLKYWTQIRSESSGLAKLLSDEVSGRRPLDALDPFLVAVREGRSGFLTLRDVAPPGFEKSELYARTYVQAGFLDVVEHVTEWKDFKVAAGTMANRSFEADEISRQRVAGPVIEACLRRLAGCYTAEEGQLRVPPRRSEIEGRLARFGADALTEREREVIHLLLHGHNSESVAQRLGISWHTVRRHRKNAYAKLGVTSQGELFYLLLKTLGLEDDG